MKDFEADDLEEAVLREERERVMPLLKRCEALVGDFHAGVYGARPPARCAELLADLRYELSGQEPRAAYGGPPPAAAAPPTRTGKEILETLIDWPPLCDLLATYEARLAALEAAGGQKGSQGQ